MRLINRLATYIEAHWLLVVFALAFLGFLIRVVNLQQSPPSLYWEEAALGYDAYAVFKTGKDSHGNPWPITAFVSFGDYKPALYFYAIIPFIALFDLSVWAVRMPSVLAGTSLILAVGLLSFLLFSRERSFPARWIAILSALFTTISPWAIQFSRGGWEVNLATAFVSWGVVLWLWATQNMNETTRKTAKVSSGTILFTTVAGTVLMCLALYTYHATRVVVPGLLIALALHRMIASGIFQPPWQKWTVRLNQSATLGQSLLLAIVCSFILALPLLQALRQPVIQQRFAETSLLADGRAVQLSNALREEAGQRWWAKVLYHRWIVSSWLVAQNAASHFTPQFLFLTGDANLRHSTQMAGLFYPLDALWIVMGLWGWRKLSRSTRYLLGLWLCVGVVPAALTQAAPHALRLLPTLPVWMMIVASGIVGSFESLTSALKRFSYASLFTFVLAGSVLLVFSIQFGLHWRYLQVIYPVVADEQWQYGYAEMIQAVSAYQKTNPNTPIYITREYGRPAMYYWFFTKADPVSVQKNDSVAEKDQEEILSYQNMHFISTVNEAKPGLIVASPKGLEQLQKQQRDVTLLSTIRGRNNQPIWQIFQLSE